MEYLLLFAFFLIGIWADWPTPKRPTPPRLKLLVREDSKPDPELLRKRRD